jgi:hypothetical protein
MPTIRTGDVAFMYDLEQRFQRATQLADRSQYKIFYCQVHSAPILTLGVNPGGDPTLMNANGFTTKNGGVAAASSGFYENNEHDVLDCEWTENFGLRRLLVPLLGGDLSRIRNEVVKTNLAFRRSVRKSQIKIDAAISETAPFLAEIIGRVQPKLILLTGIALQTFAERFAKSTVLVVPPERDPGVGHVVFAAARATLRRPPTDLLVVQVAHASQFSWTYERYSVVQRIQELLEA